MDLNELKITDEEVEMPLYHPATGEKLDIGLKVVGDDSAEARQKKRKLVEEYQKKAPRNDVSRLSMADDEEFGHRLTASYIVGFTGPMKKDGKKLEYSKQAALDIVKEHPWIAEQVRNYVADRANFMNR